MGSIKTNKVEGGSVANRSAQTELASKNKTQRRTSSNGSRTYRKDNAGEDFSDMWGAIWQDTHAFFRFIGGGIGSYLYPYYELGVGIKNVVADGTKYLWQRGRSLFTEAAPQATDSEETNELKNNQPKLQKEMTIQRSGSQLTIPLKTIETTRLPYTKVETEYLKIDCGDLEGLQAREAAVYILQRTREPISPDAKVSMMLNDIACGQPFEFAARYFSPSHRLKRSDGINTVTSLARTALVRFISRNTGNLDLALRVAELICKKESDTSLPVEENKTEPAIQAVDTSAEAICIPIFRSTTFTTDELSRIRNYEKIIGLPSQVVDHFLQVIGISTSSHSTFSQEEVIQRVGFLEALSKLRVNHDVETLPSNLVSLEDEYQSYLEYLRADEGIRRDIGLYLDGSTSSELHSYSTRNGFATFLADKEHDALRLAKRFVRNIVALDTNGAEGTIRLFKLAQKKEKSDPRYIFGYYIKAEAALSLQGEFTRRCSESGGFKMTMISPNEIEAQDLNIETNDRVYLIKIKSNLRRAIEGTEEIRSIADRARGLDNFERLVKDRKEIIPVCVINGVGGAITYIEDGVITEKNSESFFYSLSDLLSIRQANPKFELWDINAKNIDSILRAQLNPASTIFDDLVA